MANINCLVTNILQNIFFCGWVNDDGILILEWHISLEHTWNIKYVSEPDFNK